MLLKMNRFLRVRDVVAEYRIPPSLVMAVSGELEGVPTYTDAKTGEKHVLERDVDDLIEKVVRQDRPDRPDGVYRPSRVRVNGTDYDRVPAKKWLMIECLWAKPFVVEVDVIAAVYGDEADFTGTALASLCKHTNTWLRRVACPLTVQTRKGHLRLVRENM